MQCADKVSLHSSQYVCDSIRSFAVQALHLVDIMEDDGVSPDVATWGTLMSAAKYLGQPELAEAVSPASTTAAVGRGYIPVLLPRVH